MPWNDNNGKGPWGAQGGSQPGGSGGGGGQKPNSPWGQPGGGRSPGAGSDDLEAQIRKVQERFRGAFGGGGSGGKTGGPGGLGGAGLGIIAFLVVIAWIFSGVFIVDAGEQGVIKRFGKFDRTVSNGVHVHLPFPIEESIIVTVEQINRVNVGFATSGGREVDQRDESLMLTGDQNIVDIDFSVLWRISDAGAYLFNVQNPDEAVKAVAESAMREVVGNRNLEPIITRERGVVQTEARDLMQATLDSYGAGIIVTQVQLSKADPPAEVIDSFRDVVNAGQDAERTINEATAYRNQVVPEARGTAARMLQEAEAYRERVVRESTGEAERFRLIYEEYRKAPRVTRERMYLETMESVLGRADKILLDTGEGGVVPFLPLDRLGQNRTNNRTVGGQ
jgi:membrane protease subunit HflK